LLELETVIFLVYLVQVELSVEIWMESVPAGAVAATDWVL